MDNRGILDWPPRDRNGNKRIMSKGSILKRFETEPLVSIAKVEMIEKAVENVPEV